VPQQRATVGCGPAGLAVAGTVLGREVLWGVTAGL